MSPGMSPVMLQLGKEPERVPGSRLETPTRKPHDLLLWRDMGWM